MESCITLRAWEADCSGPWNSAGDINPKAIFTAALTVGSSTVGQDDVLRSFVIGLAREQNTVEAKTMALGEASGQHSGGVTLTSPRRHHVVSDVPARLRQCWCQLVSHHERAEVVLAGDIPVHGGRHVPSRANALALGHEAVEVFAGGSEPVSRGTAEEAVGLLAGKIRGAHGRRRPCQVRLFSEPDHPLSEARVPGRRQRLSASITAQGRTDHAISRPPLGRLRASAIARSGVF